MAEGLVFLVLFLGAVGIAAYLSTRYHGQLDWTAGARNTLSPASQALLARLEGPITATAYAREDEILRGRIRDLVERYRRHKGDLALSFVNPDTVPDRVRELGVTVDGELVIEYRGRREHVQNPSEQSLSNALQRLARASERHLTFVAGHGERDPRGRANHDLGDWGRQLEQRGVKIDTVNLAEAGAVPEHTSVLVLAGPQVRLLPGEVERIRDYVRGGGNLLWLADPGDLGGLEPLAEDLGVERQPGTVVDPTTRLFGIDDPTITLVTRYPFHDALQDFDLVTVFPGAAPLAAVPPPPWEAQALLTTAARAWSEVGVLEGKVAFDADRDRQGPLDIGFALERAREAPNAPAAGDPSAAGIPPSGEGAAGQRVVVLGDGDFLSNAFLGNAGNLDLGLNLVNWLASDDLLIAVPAKTAPDTGLVLSETAAAVIGFGFLLVLPLALAGTGGLVWYRRRRR